MASIAGYRTRASHAMTQQGTFAGYIGSCVDVTELMTKDEALRQSEERMRLAAAAVNLGIWEWHLATNEIWATNARRAVLGSPSTGKVTFEDFMSQVHPDDREPNPADHR